MWLSRKPRIRRVIVVVFFLNFDIRRNLVMQTICIVVTHVSSIALVRSVRVKLRINRFKW